MAETRTLLKISDLPDELLEKIGCEFLNHKQLAATMLTCRKFSLFQETITAAKLIEQVDNADYAAIAEIQDCKLFFKHVNYVLKNGSTEWISPLKMAFRNLDTYMWKMFFEKVQHDSHYRECFIKQAHEQKEQVNLKPFFDKHKLYRRKYNLWFYEIITDKALDAEWLNVGKMQREVLPRHMLKEFCRKGELWNARSTFDVDMNPPPTDSKIYSHLFDREETLFPLEPKKGLGFHYALIRERTNSGDFIIAAVPARPSECVGHYAPRVAKVWRHKTMHCLNDLNVFQRLYEVRREDQVKLLSQIKHSTENKSKITI